mgnify:CR=1 FL=1
MQLLKKLITKDMHVDKPRLAFIGGGNMAKSLIGGLIDKGFSSRCISVSDPVKKNLDQLNRKFGIATISDNSIAAKDVDLIVLCVKPQILESVCKELQASLNQMPPAISIAAGIPLSLLMDWLGEDTPIIRCMPNTPALVQSGAAGMFANQKVDKKLRNLAEEIFDAVGLCCWLEKEEDIDLVTAVSGSGPGQRVTKADATSAVSASPSPTASALASVKSEPQPAMTGTTAISSSEMSRSERPVLMSPMRRRIAERLVEAQHQAALLTTFNEVDMTSVMELRKKFKDNFVDRHGVKLGFMSFFVRAAVEALNVVPQVNAEFRDPHIVYRDFCDIGIAVGGGKGLVVPILRNAEQMNFAQIEQSIGDFARRAADNKVKLEELQGGTFTISNGGVYGSMLSTPIINPPQSGILGLHAIQERPVAVDGQVVVRPMMYVALSYDHRIVDGREAVTFLKRIKEMIEDPTRLMLEC